MSKLDVLMIFVFILSVMQLATMFSFGKYVQAINKQVELNSEFVGRLLRFVDTLKKKHPELDSE